MRTGSEIYDILANNEYNENVARFTNLLRNESNGETIIVGTYLLVRELELIMSVTGPTISDLGLGLEKPVLERAEHLGQIGGIPFDDFEWEKDDDGELPHVDEGLRWVGFIDIIDAFNKVADSYVKDI